MLNPATNNRPLGTIDFEITDFADARAAMDELPPGVGSLNAHKGDWATQRRKPVATDRALASSTLDWLMALPAHVRPQELPRLFPRLANELAQLWSSRAHCAAFIDELLEDRRGGRRGFPADISRELTVLRESLAG